MFSWPDWIAAIMDPVTDPGSRTFLLGLAVAVGVAALVEGRVRAGLRGLWGGLGHRSSSLDLQLLASRQILRLFGALPALGGAYWIATSLVNPRKSVVLLGV